MKKRFTSVMLSMMLLVSLFCSFAPVNAAGIASSPNFSSYSAATSPGSAKGKVNVSVSAKGNFTMYKIGFSELKFQEKSGLFWNTVSTVYDDYEYNTVTYGEAYTFSNCTSGNKYRAVVTIYCETSTGGWSDVVITTGEATAP